MLSNLAAYPLERSNLAQDPQFGETLLDMRAQLFARLEETGIMIIPLHVPMGFRADRKSRDED